MEKVTYLLSHGIYAHINTCRLHYIKLMRLHVQAGLLSHETVRPLQASTPLVGAHLSYA